MIRLCDNRSCVTIAIATADVVIQALAYNDSSEAATHNGLLAMGGRWGSEFSGTRQPTD